MKTNWKHLDKFRTQEPPYLSPLGSTFGAFQIPFNGSVLRIIATDGRMDAKGEHDTEWEHVSVHSFDPIFKKQKTPNWSEMCFVKSQFWEDDEVVVELHVAKADWISVHDHVLHLWRPTKQTIPLPPKICV